MCVNMCVSFVCHMSAVCLQVPLRHNNVSRNNVSLLRTLSQDLEPGGILHGGWNLNWPLDASLDKSNLLCKNEGRFKG